MRARERARGDLVLARERVRAASAAALCALLLGACAATAESTSTEPAVREAASTVEANAARAHGHGTRTGGDAEADVVVGAIWNDPVFQKQFIAGYGINSDIEPRVTPEEVAILEKIRPLMADGSRTRRGDAP